MSLVEALAMIVELARSLGLAVALAAPSVDGPGGAQVYYNSADRVHYQCYQLATNEADLTLCQTSGFTSKLWITRRAPAAR